MKVKKLWPLFIIIGVCIIFFYKVFFQFQVPFPGDLLVSEYAPWKYESFLGYNPGAYPNKAQYFDVIRQLYPWKMLAVDLWKQGVIPLWNPYNYSGSPLLANNQSAVFYPLNLVFLLASKGFSWSIYIFLQPFLASIFMYLYIRSLKVSHYAALVSSISFGFSLFMSTFLEYGNFGHTVLWLPFLLFSVEKLRDKKFVWIMPMSLAVAFMFFAGHLQIAVSVFVFTICYVVFRNMKNRKVLVTALFSLLLGCGIAAIQLFPTFELLANSARSAHLPKLINELFLLQPQQLILLFIPDIYGNPATRNYLLTDTYPGNAIYIGIIPLLFVLLAVIGKKKDSILKLFIAFCLLFIFLFVRNPISEFIFNLPIFSASSPSNFFFLFGFSLSVLCAFGFDEAKQSFRKNLIPAGLILGLTFLLVGFHLFFQVPINFKQFLLSLGIIIISIAAFLSFRILKSKHLWLIPLVILTFDLFYFFIKFNPFVPPSLMLPPTDIVSFIQKKAVFDRFIGYKAGSIESNFSTEFRTFSPDGYDPLNPKIYNQYTNSISRSDANVRLDQTDQLNALAVKYILDRSESASDQNDFPPEKFKNIYSLDGWKVYENIDVLPRAYIKNKTEIMPVQIVSYKTNSASFNTGGVAGLLVLSDVYFPGWEAFIDGKRTDIQKVDGIFRGVNVTSGTKRVSFEYKPRSFYNGLIITIISVIGLFSFTYLLTGWKKR